MPKPQRRLPALWTVESTQDGMRCVEVRRSVVMVAYKVPSELHADSVGMKFAVEMLVDNPSGRLYKSLVTTGKTVDVFSTSIGSFSPGLQIIGTIAKKEMLLSS